jgi:hypothetical protein
MSGAGSSCRSRARDRCGGVKEQRPVHVANLMRWGIRLRRTYTTKHGTVATMTGGVWLCLIRSPSQPASHIARAMMANTRMH